MSHIELVVTAIKDEVLVTVEKSPSVVLQAPPTPGIAIIAAGNVGPPGPPGKWEALTQSEYDLLTPPDPNTLYVIIQ